MDDSSQTVSTQPPESDPTSTTAPPSSSAASASSSLSASLMPSKLNNHRWDGQLYKLTINYLKTYKDINQSYHAARSRKKDPSGLTQSSKPKLNNDGRDDENHNYIVIPKEILNEEYEVQEAIGKGSYGLVVRAIHTRTKEEVAIKIIRSKFHFHTQAKVEIRILEKLNKEDPENKYFTVRMIKHFVHHNHICIVFEMLSISLYDVLRKVHFKGVSLDLVRNFGMQILMALQFYSLPNIRIIHCDLKPENVLLKNPNRSGLKIIDFGSSCGDNDKPFSYIQSRFYRSPEVLLGLRYSTPIDMWSLGCMLVELHTGKPLFPGKNEKDQMWKIVEVAGVPPQHMLAAGKKSHQFFEKGKDRIWRLNGSASHIERSRCLFFTLKERSRSPHVGSDIELECRDREYLALVDLLRNMLVCDPDRRILPSEALQHEFFTMRSLTAVPRPMPGVERTSDLFKAPPAVGHSSKSRMPTNEPIGISSYGDMSYCIPPSFQQSDKPSTLQRPVEVFEDDSMNMKCDDSNQGMEVSGMEKAAAVSKPQQAAAGSEDHLVTDSMNDDPSNHGGNPAQPSSSATEGANPPHYQAGHPPTIERHGHMATSSRSQQQIPGINTNELHQYDQSQAPYIATNPSAEQPFPYGADYTKAISDSRNQLNQPLAGDYNRS